MRFFWFFFPRCGSRCWRPANNVVALAAREMMILFAGWLLARYRICRSFPASVCVLALTTPAARHRGYRRSGGCKPAGSVRGRRPLSSWREPTGPPLLASARRWCIYIHGPDKHLPQRRVDVRHFLLPIRIALDLVSGRSHDQIPRPLAAEHEPHTLHRQVVRVGGQQLTGAWTAVSTQGFEAVRGGASAVSPDKGGRCV